jgi:hypothetical protein
VYTPDVVLHVPLGGKRLEGEDALLQERLDIGALIAAAGVAGIVRQAPARGARESAQIAQARS